MINTELDQILSADQSRYSLVIAVAKRAREISNEAESKGEILIEKPVNLAVADLADHKYKIISPKDDEDEAE